MTVRLASSARRRTSRHARLCSLVLGGCCALSSLAVAAEPRSQSQPEPRPLPPFERIVIDDNFPGAYQVEVVDVNGDAKPDIVALGGGTCAWYENPTWKKRIVTTPRQTPGIISTATADLDGDGKAEIAIAYEFNMNQPAKGKLLLAHPGPTFDDPWSLVPVAEVPSIHRIRWSEARYTSPIYGSPSDSVTLNSPPVAIARSLIVAPIFGPSATPPVFAEEPAHLVMFSVYLPKNEGREQRVVPIRGGSIGGGLGNGTTGYVVRPGDIIVGSMGGGIGGSDALVLDRNGLRQDVLKSLVFDTRPRLGPAPAGWLSRPVPRELGTAPVLHAIDIYKSRRSRQKPGGSGLPGMFSELPGLILGASNLGVTWTGPPAIPSSQFVTRPLVAGASGPAPKRGASEIHHGWLNDGRLFLATVEPWHGTDVAVYFSETSNNFPMFLNPERTALDTTLKDGHALWVADVDGDGDDEVFAGYRGKGTSVIGYDFDGKNWNRTVIDTAIAAQDLRGGDIDGDGTPDIVGVGGSTHNVVWYRPKRD